MQSRHVVATRRHSESHALDENIEAIKIWQRASIHQRSRVEHLSDEITKIIAGGPALLFHVMWFGFWLNAASGILLLLAYPTKALTNPVFYLKLTLIVVAMGLFVVIRRRLLDQRPPADERAGRAMQFYGAAALVCWAGAITAGRLLAYTYSRLTASW